ncbi:RHS repeat domain-containing protein [Burkholderia sp. Bp9004]|uniref:RHS repeat domain-containing protein n=1 Tax=Burkholderia sp. Bp9004 TaxID=2184559 RepID=UPI000F5DB101|nr:RHS repeat-associated core domain-containing protein [Burkholderia sp. Bp9004]RQZ57487.1 hypothetical protein DIE08_34780 [Burkholderia sp. Bp9004]
MAFTQIGYYQCDQIGSPKELTDEHSEIAWSAEYRAWGVAQEAIRKASGKALIANPIRFQGQYDDHETGLHYNRYRYYDPEVGRFVSKDPIEYVGGYNIFPYAPNPVEWVDPLGLSRCPSAAGSLSQLKGISIAKVEKVIANNGFTKTKDDGKNATWNHFDGSEVCIHRYGNKNPSGCKSGNNAHVHK